MIKLFNILKNTGKKSDSYFDFQELDEKEYLSLWLVMCEIRNRYCSLHDIVIKNLEKIKKPRSSNAENLY